MVLVEAKTKEAYLPSLEDVRTRFGDLLLSENPYWGEDNIPRLYSLAIKCLANSFNRKPWLGKTLSGRDRENLLLAISIQEPLELAFTWIEDSQAYWKRRALELHPGQDLSLHGNSWRRLCVERTISEELEKFRPMESDYENIKLLSKTVGGDVKRLMVTQFHPPTVMVPVVREPDPVTEFDVDIGTDDEKSEADSDQHTLAETPDYREPTPVQVVNMDVIPNHVDLSNIIGSFSGLEEIHLCYQVKSCGVDFRWNVFGMTEKDADNIASGIENTHQLHTLSVRNSKVSDASFYTLIDGMEKLKHVRVLDFPNNVITDESIETLVKGMANKKFLVLNLSNNKITDEGASNFAVHLSSGKSTLTHLDLSLNFIQDEGGISLMKAISLNRELNKVNLAANKFTSKLATSVRDMLSINRKLKSLNLSSNRFDEKGGKEILKGLNENNVLTELDLRLSGVGQNIDVALEKIIMKNSQF